MTDKADDVIAELIAMLRLESYTIKRDGIGWHSITRAAAVIASQAAEIETLKEQLRIERNKTEFWKYPGGR